MTCKLIDMRTMSIFIFTLVVCYVGIVPTSAQTDSSCFSADNIERIRMAQDFLFNDDYLRADSVYSVCEKIDSNNPAWSLFRAGVLMARMTYEEQMIDTGAFFRRLNHSMSYCDTVLADSSNQSPGRLAWTRLLKGHNWAYRSLYEARFGSKLSAARYGIRAYKQYRAGLELDSTCYDLYFGLGSFHYWKTVKAGIMRYVLFMSNDKEEGIEELYLAMDSSLVHQELARSALIWVYLNEKQYDSTIAIAQEFVERYPDGCTYLWPIAQAQYDQKQYEEARDTYERIRERLQERPAGYYNLIECDFYIVRCLRELDRDDEARIAAQRINDYLEDVHEVIRKKQRSHLRELIRVGRQD